MTHEELREATARAICGAFFKSQGLPPDASKIEWDMWLPEADAAIAVVFERCAQVLLEFATLANEIERLRRKVNALEGMRPHWAQGYTSDSIAAQTSIAALSQIWKLLGADNQTDAIHFLKEMEEEIKKAEKERDEARAACNQCRLAFAGYVSTQSAIDMLDNLGGTEGRRT
jgi:benzoyl-CoA reductase/2-hydroxyglutaryl-CoA dehydratase subunit BcrC/BadD/HgdB